MEKNTSMNNRDSDLIKLVRAASGTETPCNPSLDWLAGLPAGTTPEQAWGLCPNATWLFWISGRIGIDKVLIVLSACDIAESVLDLVPSGEDRPRLAIETIKAWTRGEASLEDVQKTANAARTSARAASRAATDSASAAARVASYAAADAANAAATAAATATFATAITYATAAAANAVTSATYASASEARIASLSHSADLVRVRIPWSLVAERLTTLGIAV